jgi:hypothetical protein
MDGPVLVVGAMADPRRYVGCLLQSDHSARRNTAVSHTIASPLGVVDAEDAEHVVEAVILLKDDHDVLDTVGGIDHSRPALGTFSQNAGSAR